MELALKALIKEARQLTEANYCFGFDSYVECYDNSEWQEFLEDYEVKTREQLISALNEDCERYQQRGHSMEAFTNCEKCISEHTRETPKHSCDCHEDGLRIYPFKPINK